MTTCIMSARGAKNENLTPRRNRSGATGNITIWKAAAVLAALLVWQAAAMLLDQSLLLVSPVTVAERLFTLMGEAEFWQTVAFSFSRIVLGFFLALILGIVIAAAASSCRAVEIFIWPYIAIIKAIPVASFIIISLIWLSARRISIFISFLMVLPIVYSNVLEGIKSTDVRLLEMAKVFKMPLRRRVAYIYLPQLRPFLVSACSTALGLCWKSGVAAEVIGITNGSIGEELYRAKIYLATADLFAWTAVIVVISVVFEKLFLYLLKKALSLIK